MGLMVFILVIVAALMISVQQKNKQRDAKIEYEARQKELERGRAIKKYLKEEEELERYRRGDYSDPEEEIEEDLDDDEM